MSRDSSPAFTMMTRVIEYLITVRGTEHQTPEGQPLSILASHYEVTSPSVPEWRNPTVKWATSGKMPSCPYYSCAYALYSHGIIASIEEKSCPSGRVNKRLQEKRSKMNGEK
ncbi:hypothetical protein RRG08_004233 [Elysia crispata]|uniref:Uncharacterized protein n=1 Tax=Elysia crispata TaxID=231223 RepID=A0AAE1DHA6_9GAST|nr:hypothetical protein RRG08_004233 [Elysia crispata]